MSDSNRAEFFPAVELVRGIAAVMVSGIHVFKLWATFRDQLVGPEASFFLLFFTGFGPSSVTLFFVISGFVLKLSLHRMQNERRPLIALRFALNRCFRIYPAAILVILLFAVVEPWAVLHGLSHRPWTEIFSNALLLQSTMDWPTWSLRVEMAATPIIIAACFLRARWGVAALALCCAALAALSFARSLYLDDMIGRYLFMFIAGMLLPDCAP